MKFQYDIVGILMGISWVSSMISPLHAFFHFWMWTIRDLGGLTQQFYGQFKNLKSTTSESPKGWENLWLRQSFSAALFHKPKQSKHQPTLGTLTPSLITNLKIRRSSPKTTLMTLAHQTSASCGDFDPLTHHESKNSEMNPSFIKIHQDQIWLRVKTLVPQWYPKLV